MPFIDDEGKEFRLCLIDTNIYSDLSKYVSENKSSFLTEYFNKIKPLICFSIPSIVEMRRNKEVFNKFLNLSDGIQTIALNTFEVISDKERQYGKRIPEREVLFNSFNPIGFRKNETYNLKWLINKAYEEDQLGDMETARDQYSKKIMEIWKNNFIKAKEFTQNKDFLINTLPLFNKKIGHPRKDFLTDTKKENIDYYAKLLGCILMIQRGENNINKENVQIKTNINNYPAWKTLLCLEYIYLTTNREFTINDVYDALILSPAPYMDIVITENYQAQQLKNIQSIVPGLETTEIFTMSTLKKRICQVNHNE